MLRRFEQVLLFSGGIDSFVAYHFLKFPPTVYFDLKNRYSKKEIQVIQSLIPQTIIDNSLNLSDIEKDSGYIPYRNLFLAMMASSKYSDNVVIAGLQDDVVSDKNEEIFKQFSEMLSILEKRSIQVVSPFWQMTKSEVVKWFLIQYPEKVNELLSTISCYSSNSESTYCGKCSSCFRKWIALRANGIYLDFDNLDMIQIYKKKFAEGAYDVVRCQVSLKVITEYEKEKGYCC